MTAPPSILDLAPKLSEWRQKRKRRPLAAWKAWHQPPPLTSQAALVQALQAHKVVIALGGNRSGKTEWLRAVVVAMVLGSDHPDARAFWLRNGCNPDRFPKGPGKGWIVSLSSNDSINYHRRQIGRLLPGGDDGPLVKWFNKNGKGEARVLISVPGYSEPAEIVFKSEDQGEAAAQGDSCRIIAHDEEGDTSKVWEECGVRLWDQRGWQIMANTPLNGQTWVYHDLVQPETPPMLPTSVLWIHSLDNPFLPPEQAINHAGTNAAIAAARLRGEFVTLEGRIYPHFTRATHTIAPFRIPSDWVRYKAIDFGTRNPFACVWFTVSPGAWVDQGEVVEEKTEGARWIPDGQIIGYREHYQAEWQTSQHVKAIRLGEGWEWAPSPNGIDELVPGPNAEVVEMSWADQEDPAQFMTLNVDYDMDVSPAFKSVKDGIERVREAFSPSKVDGTPGLVFFSTLYNTIREHESYVWAKSVGGREPEKPRKKDDHTCDCVRYGVMGISRE